MIRFKPVKMAVSFAVIAALTSNVFAGEYPWELKKDENGIRAWLRKVEGSPIVEYKGMGTVNGNVQRVMTLFEDDSQVPKWVHDCKESRVLITKSPADKILYMSMNIPWPFQDRDVVYRRVRTIDTATGTARYNTSVVSDVYPPQKGKVRIPYIKGLWIFKPLPKGRTEITYQQHLDVGGKIPDWVVNLIAVNIPYYTIVYFRSMVEGKNPQIPSAVQAAKAKR